MLTPVEARLQHFDRVVLGNMQDNLWPGGRTQSPWLNLAQQAQLGLPSALEHSALMAHDVLMLASGGSVLLTYPTRDGGSPSARSRFVERLVTLLAAHGIAESTIACHTYKQISAQIDAAPDFAPEPAPMPTPNQRPAVLPVSALDLMFSDPYSIYARYILKLRPLDEIDAEPEARDFGSIAHRALQQLTTHWNEAGEGPDTAALEAIADTALSDLAERPSVQLFWRARLVAALHFVNAQESARRAAMDMRVHSETPIEQAIALPQDRTLTLQGRLDRLEEGDGMRVLADYKTGKPPTPKDITEGRAVQLLAYALLLNEQGRAPDALEYWGLPSGKREAGIEYLEFGGEVAAHLQGQLLDALAELMNPTTPLLARPIAGNERFENDYDGISRYDEWAG